MGWFLKSSAGGRRAKQRWQQRLPWRDPQWASILKVLSVALAALMAMAGWRLAQQSLLKHAEAHISDGLAPQQVHLAEVPPWIDALTRQQLQRLAALQMSSPSIDGHQLHRTVDALRRNPWIEGIRKVRRVQDGLVVHASFRRPTALVERPDAYHRVDREGVLLPGMFVASGLKALHLPVIVGVRSPPASLGEVWPGEDLNSALALVRVLSGQPFASQIGVIDVHTRDRQGRTRLTLVTPHVKVRWGLTPGREGPIERDTATKLKRLARVLRNQRWIANGRPRPAVEIYGPTILVRRTRDRSDQSRPTGYMRFR